MTQNWLGRLTSQVAALKIGLGMLGLVSSLSALSGCDDTDLPAQGACPPGGENCSCLAHDECASEQLFCADGICRRASCEQGAEDCACYPNQTCNTGGDVRLVCDEGLCRKSTCEPGKAGCGCLADLSCEAGLSCSDASGSLLCAPLSCKTGSEGCACDDAGACADTSDTGRALACVDGVCRAPSCELGSNGCGCQSDGSCNSGYRCNNGTCFDEACADGDLACPCKAGNECNSAALVCSDDKLCVNAPNCQAGSVGCACDAHAACESPLVCQEGVCIDTSCPAGDRGCDCKADKSCTEQGVVCSASNRCVDAECPEGTEGCACRADDSCGSAEDPAVLTCVGEKCVNCRKQDCGTPGLIVPASLVCFTPCRTGYTDSKGGYHGCDSDQLMRHEPDEACLDGKTCRFGSCLKDDDMVPSCVGDVDCPDFQNCVGGRCYAMCDNDSDCPDSLACHRHACRRRCASDDRSCPEHTACSMTDPVSGFCMPVGAPPEGPKEGTVLGTFDVSSDNLSFTSGNTNGSFTITNHGPVAAKFVVSKVEHTGTGLKQAITTNPMPWLKIGDVGQEQLANSVEVLVDPEETRTFSLLGAATNELSRWQGVLEVRSKDTRLGARQIRLSYVGSIDGRWIGSMVTFANFGTKNLTGWMNDRGNVAKLNVVGNALVARWGVFRRGNISRLNFEAALQSAETESWKWPTVVKDCSLSSVCYPFVDPNNPFGTGLDVFTADATGTPVPTGMSELPIAFDLKAKAGSPQLLEGRIVTSEALQYPGDPALSVQLASDPTDANCVLNSAAECVVFVDSLTASVNVGGRYGTDKYATSSTCASGFSASNVPWLVPGFLLGTNVKPDTGQLFHSECRDNTQPGLGDPAANAAMAAANPVPDGKTRTRMLTLVDGAIVDQQTMYLLVRETFPSFLGAGDASEFANYGVMRLRRTPAELDAASFDGHVPPTPQAAPLAAQPPVACDAALLTQLGAPAGVSLANAEQVAGALLDGTAIGATPPPLEAKMVHYYCHDTGLIDGGNSQSNSSNASCPPGSEVTYFYFADVASMPEPDLVSAEIAGLPCQNNGTCLDTLNNWRAAKKWGIAGSPPVYRCKDPKEVFCDADRTDLLAGKYFYRPTNGGAVFTPLRTAVNDAFRYKTQFRSRQGGTVGFAPEQCVPNSNSAPYCYDAPQIEQARQRIDCGLALFHDYPSLRASPSFGALADFLRISFAFSQTINPPVYTYDGFETMYAELLVMLGDDAYTAAFASRFDLSGSTHLSFQGSAFDPGGIDLSGAAGFELYRLYEATQYYTLVLNRLYRLAPVLATASGSFESFITKDTFGSYFPKIVRASAQKTRAFSELAKRYQSFNRPEIARDIIRRAYTSAYLESVVIGSLITRYIDQSGTEKAYVEKVRSDGALTYKAALHDMRDAYQNITDQVTFFGVAPDFIPFPALEPGDSNAFAKLLGLAKQRASVAATDEEKAINSNRSYEVDAASFQSELVKLQVNYDNQLADICGTLKGDDGAVYPAIPKYAYHSPAAAALGDPCGLMGTGKLNDAMGGLEVSRLELAGIDLQYANTLQEIENERARVKAQCGIDLALAEATYRVADKTLSIQETIDAAQLSRTAVAYIMKDLEASRLAMSCIVGTSTNCPQGVAALGVFTVNAAIQQVADLALQTTVQDKQREIARLQAADVHFEKLQQCNIAQVESQTLIKDKALGLKTLDLESLKAAYRLRIAASTIQGYHDQAQRIAAEAAEIAAQTINVEAARNDPNVRIYKNDDIINAERTFDSAMAAAYEATKAYQYYTSQTYGHADDIFLIRMVSHGDYDLNRYLLQLEDAYLDFQQKYGNPDDRVEIVSLRDDIFAVPRLDEAGHSVAQSKRIEQFREKLQDVALLDERGYLTVPFATALSRVSPLTRDHKIKRVEAEIVGSDVGDAVGRIYLVQKGTGSVRPVTEGADPLYYRFPELTAVVDTFFNGVRTFAPEIYQTDRLRDRPFANSRWDLVFNQRDEAVNGDINLASLTDIRIYIYYTDFTGL